MLTAIGIDPNDCIYLIAFGVVEVESLATWKWFLETLKQDLGIARLLSCNVHKQARHLQKEPLPD